MQDFRNETTMRRNKAGAPPLRLLRPCLSVPELTTDLEVLCTARILLPMENLMHFTSPLSSILTSQTHSLHKHSRFTDLNTASERIAPVSASPVTLTSDLKALKTQQQHEAESFSIWDKLFNFQSVVRHWGDNLNPL